MSCHLTGMVVLSDCSYFSGNTVIARAIKNIKKGDIIAENYGPIFTQKPLRERLQVKILPCVQYTHLS